MRKPVMNNQTTVRLDYSNYTN